jgi:4'-phosphopantetheinyl transferase
VEFAGVSVRVSRSPRLLENTIAEYGHGEVQVGHLCPRCGSTQHGPLVVTHATAKIFANRSRVGKLEAIAVSAIAPVGVDIESVSQLGLASVDAVLLHPGEAGEAEAAANPALHRATLWTAKEAVLKATGRGLDVDPGMLRLRTRGDGIELVSWPAELGLVGLPRIHSFVVDDDIVGAVAILA